MSKQVVISAKHLKKSFGNGGNAQALGTDVSVDIYEGGFTVIMGLSGAGKSARMW